MGCGLLTRECRFTKKNSGHDFRYPELAHRSRIYGAVARETQRSLDNDVERESISMVIYHYKFMIIKIQSSVLSCRQS